MSYFPICYERAAYLSFTNAPFVLSFHLSTCLSCVPRATYSSLIFPSEDPLPVLSPSGTSSSLDILSTSSLHTLSPSNSSTGAVMLASGSSLPNIVGWSGSEE